MLERLNLRSSLSLSQPIIGPSNIHEVPGLYLPVENSILQHQLADLSDFTEKNLMKLNIKKTKIIPFIVTRNYDFLPQLYFPGCSPLEVIYETRLLGVTLTSNLSWSNHILDITRRATKNLWVLIRFKTLGGTIEQLSTVYQTRIRSILEFASPVFHSSLTKEQSKLIESTQKKALAIILGRNYNCYEYALSFLGLDRLDSRREKLCYNFALKCTRSVRHRSMFPLNPSFRPNMRKQKLFLEPQCKTSRYYNSSIPYMARLLNNKQ